MEKDNNFNNLPTKGDTVTFRLVADGPLFQGRLVAVSDDGMCDIELAPGSTLLANQGRLIDFKIVQ